MAGNVATSTLAPFDFQKKYNSADVFCTLSRIFCSAGLSFAPCSFDFSFLCRSSGFREFKQQLQRQRQ